MKKLILFFISWITCLTSIGQVNILWQTRYTSTGSNTDKAEDMVIDASGNVYVTGIGRIAASTNFDYVTIKYNSSGVQQWAARYNGVGNGLDEAHAIAIDAAGNVYVTGLSYGGATPGYDYATVKYNSAGVQQWATSYNNGTNGSDEARDIAVDGSGNVYITGTSDGTAGALSAATTIQYNSAGVQQWVKRYDGAGNDIDVCYAICLDGTATNVFVTGTSKTASNDFDFITIKYLATNGNTVAGWPQNYNGNLSGGNGLYDEARAITVDGSGNVYVTGYTQTAVLTNYDYATVKYNSAGTQLWAKTYEGTGTDDDRANMIKLDGVGNVYITGYSVGGGIDAQDILTIKYNNGGTQKWVTRYNGTANGYDEGKALAIDAGGNIYITGYSNSTASGSDYTTIKYDSLGVQQWLTKYNGTANNADQAAAIAVDNTGNVYVSGFSKGTGTIEDYETIKYCQLTANAGSDISICKGASTTLNASATSAVSYIWTPAAGLSSTTIFNPVATPTVTTSYVVSITNGGGCVDVDTVVVTVVPLPVPIITASGPTVFCIGDSVKLTVSANTSYLWSTSSTLQTIKVVTSGTYSVTVTNSTGCKGSVSQMVMVNPLPVISAGTNKNVCLGSSINLSATGGASYVWYYGNTLSDSTIANPAATPVVTTTYTLVGTAASGCKNTATVKLTVLSVPTIDAGLNNNVCSGSSVNIVATGGVSYVWAPPTGLSNTTIANPVASPLTTTTYTVTGTAANGCKNSAKIKITVLSVPLIDSGLNDSICVGSSINLQATGGIFYVWNPGSTLDDSTIFDPIAKPINTTTYTVIGTATNGCTSASSVKISVFSYPVIDAGLNDSVCTGKTIQLLASGGISYSWSPASTLSNPTISNPIANPVTTTTYTVIGTGVAGCKSTDIIKIKVLPIPIINAGYDSSICPGKTVQLKASGGVSYIWNPAGTLNNSTIYNPVGTPITTTTYTVVGKGANGCVSNDMVKITVLANPSVPTIKRGNDTLYCMQVATTYQWYSNGVLIPGATNKIYLFTQNGNYYVQVFNASGCSTVSTTISIIDIGVGEIAGLNLIALYPNPATNELTIELSLLKANTVKINLMNMEGQFIFTDIMNQFTGSYKKQINLHEVPNGIYYLQVITNDQVINKKVVKQ